MIQGIGVDIVKTERFKKERSEKLNQRLFTEYEIDYIKTPQTAAGLFAAKEAVAKAMGIGFVGFWPCDIEIKHTTEGKPYVVLHNRAKELFEGRQIHLSISHTDTDAVAFVVVG